jgi:alkylated DNA nucleotide flippase Atl1
VLLLNRLSNFYISSTSQPATVDALYIKLKNGEPNCSVVALQFLDGEGIKADVAGSNRSPRQVLIVRKEDLDAFGLPIGYLKENLVVSGLSAEDFQPGRLLVFEGGSSMHLAFHCEPCKTIAQRVPNLKSIIGRRGLLGVVVKPGLIVVGARFKSVPSELSAMSSIARERVLQVVRCIPKGKVLDYATLLQIAGLQRVYFRAIPSYLKSATDATLPAHRVVTSRFNIPEFMPNSKQRLKAEVNLEQLRQHIWQPKILDVLSANPLFTTAP